MIVMKRLIFAVIAVLLGVPAFGQVGPIITPGGDALAVPVTVGNGGTGSATGVGLFDTCTDSVGTDAYACSTATTCPASLAATRPVLFTAGTANTGAATFAYCGLAAKAVVKTIGGISTALADNDILAKQPVLVRYNATDDNWKMVSAISNAPAAAVTVGGAITGGTASRVLYEDASNLLGESANLLYDATTLQVGSATTAGNAITKSARTITGASATSNFLNITGAFNATLTDTANAAYISVAADNDGYNQYGLFSETTGTGPVSAATVGVAGLSSAASSAYGVGLSGRSSGAADIGVGVSGLSYGGTNRIGGYFALAHQGAPASSAGIIVDNAAQAVDIAQFRDNGTPVFTIADGGALVVASEGVAATLQFGVDVNGAAVAQTLKAHDGITGTDIAGANLTLAGGRGTGAGVGGDVYLQASPALASGTTAQTLESRFLIKAKQFALADNTATTFAISTLGNDTFAGGTVHYCVYAADATTAGQECGSFDFGGQDVTAGAGGETCATPGKIGTPLQVLTGSTLSVTFAATTGTDLCNWRVTADTDIVTPINLYIKLLGVHNSGAAFAAQ